MSAGTRYHLTSGPHLASSDEAGKRFWLKSAALLPLIAAVLFAGGADFLRILSLCLLVALGVEVIGDKVTGQKNSLANGDAFLTGILLALILPAGCPWPKILMAGFAAIAIVCRFFGGFGNRLFHPALFGGAILDVFFGSSPAAPALFQCAGEPVVFSAILISAFLLILQGQIYFETPLYYGCIAIATAFALGRLEPLILTTGVVIFAAYFLATDFVTLPLTRKGTNIAVMLAALLGVFFAVYYGRIFGIGLGILIVNLMTPWLNDWLRPSPESGT